MTKYETYRPMTSEELHSQNEVGRTDEQSNQKTICHHTIVGHKNKLDFSYYNRNHSWKRGLVRHFNMCNNIFVAFCP